MPRASHRPTDDGLVHVAGARLHNLRAVSTSLPRGRLVAFTGVSGSGKSSLAFGTLHGESQRRYLESVAPFARRLVGSAVDPRVDAVEGLPPTVALEQRTGVGGSRSSVGSVSALSNSLRLLYSRVGDHPADVLERGSALHDGRLTSDCFSPNTPEGVCPRCRGAGVLLRATEASMVPDPSLSVADGAVAAWPGAWLGKNYRDILATLGIDVHLPWRELPADTREWILHTDEEPVVTVHPVREPGRIQRPYQGQWRSVEKYLLDTVARTSAEATRRRAMAYLTSETCPGCDGHRLGPDALRVTYLGQPIWALGELPLEDLAARLERRSGELPPQAGTPEDEAERILLAAMLPVLRTVVGLGLGHLSLDRRAATLSTGEQVRLRLASQLRSGLFGVAYVLDEPSAGLHPSEKGVLLELLDEFLAGGSSVLLVEHDMALVREADWVVDIGPGAGAHGGRVLHSGPVDALPDVQESETGRYLRPGPLSLRAESRSASGELVLSGIEARTLRGVDVRVPLGCLTAVTGVSGAGKTTLVTHVLGSVLEQRVRTTVRDEVESEDDAADLPADDTVQVARVDGADGVDRLVHITQRPIGRTPRSCLATYTGLFDRVRRLFADTDGARSRGWGVGRFSYNVAEGRCEHCGGTGQVEIELVFLPGSFASCPVCHGRRYADDTLEVTWQGRTVADVLALTVDDAVDVFADDRRVARALRALSAVGLGYLTLGQPATELSGGEAQRIKLATELQRTGRGRTLYLLDEPTTGLHPADVDLLVRELERLVDAGSTVVLAEHDLRVVARADHVIDLGPGAGERGGRVVASGTPAQVAAVEGSATGRCLAAAAVA